MDNSTPGIVPGELAVAGRLRVVSKHPTSPVTTASIGAIVPKAAGSLRDWLIDSGTHGRAIECCSVSISPMIRRP